VIVPVNEAKEGLAYPLPLTVTDWLPLALPLKECPGVCERLLELVLETSDDLLTDADRVKLAVADQAADEVCDLIAVLDCEGDTVTDLDLGAVAD